MIKKLKGKENYEEWVQDVRSKLKERELLNIVHGTEKAPEKRQGFFGIGWIDDNDFEKIRNWEKNVAAATDILHQSIANNIWRKYENSKEDPAAIWSSLKILYGPSKMKMCLKLKLLRKDPATTIEEHEMKYQAIVDNLHELNVHFSPQDLSINYLITLSESYIPFILSLESTMDTLTFDEVKEKVRDEVRRLNPPRVTFRVSTWKGNKPNDFSAPERPSVSRTWTGILPKRRAKTMPDSSSVSHSKIRETFDAIMHFHHGKTGGKKQDTHIPQGAPDKPQDRNVPKSKDPVVTQGDKVKDPPKVEKPDTPKTDLGPMQCSIPHENGTYTGQVNEKNIPHGQGKWESSCANKSYEGNWVNGMKDGWGEYKEVRKKFTYEYVGTWKDGQQHCEKATEKTYELDKGVVRYEIGFHLGKKHGAGTMWMKERPYAVKFHLGKRK